MRRSPMNLPDTAPYYTDLVETDKVDYDGFFYTEPVPIVEGRTLRNWLDHDVLGAIKQGAVGGRVYGSACNRRVTSPAGDLWVTSDPGGFVTLTRFITASALVGHAAEYELHTPNDNEIDFVVTEHSGERRGITLEGHQLRERDPVAIRFVEMVNLITANATPNFNTTQRWYQLAA